VACWLLRHGVRRQRSVPLWHLLSPRRLYPPLPGFRLPPWQLPHPPHQWAQWEKVHPEGATPASPPPALAEDLIPIAHVSLGIARRVRDLLDQNPILTDVSPSRRRHTSSARAGRGHHRLSVLLLGRQPPEMFPSFTSRRDTAPEGRPIIQTDGAVAGPARPERADISQTRHPRAGCSPWVPRYSAETP
jgi:hypothetical protein